MFHRETLAFTESYDADPDSASVIFVKFNFCLQINNLTLSSSNSFVKESS